MPKKAPPPPRYYNVEPARIGVFPLDGFLSGVPAYLLPLRKTPTATSRPMRAADIASGLASIAPPSKSPRWVAFLGDYGQADQELLVACRFMLASLSYVEVDGTSPYANMAPDGRLPMFDHVAVRVSRYPADPINVELYHSVVARPDVGLKGWTRFSDYLDRMAFNGPRYSAGPVSAGPTAVPDQLARDAVAMRPKLWRLTGAHSPDLSAANFAAKLRGIP